MFLAKVEMPGIAKWMVLLTLVVWMATAVYVFALQAVFENPPSRTVGNALRIAASHFTTTLVLILLFAFAIFCTWLFFPGAVFYVPICVFLSARPIWHVFVKVMARPEVQSGGAVEDAVECGGENGAESMTEGAAQGEHTLS